MTIILPDNRKPQPPATVLRGPADASAFRVKVGRYGERWYTDTLPEQHFTLANGSGDHWKHSDAVYPSVSAIKKKAKPFEGANYIAMKRIAQKVTGPNAMALSSDYASCYEQLKSIDKLGLDAAGKRGTHVHKMAEQMLYGLPVDDRGPGGHYRGALEDFFSAYQPTLIAAEVVCIRRRVFDGAMPEIDKGYGGTGDAVIEIDGKRYFVDWKSRGEDADHAAYSDEATQLAAYAGAGYWIVEGDNGMATRIQVPDLDGLLIISVKPDGHRIYPIDFHKATNTWLSFYERWCASMTEKDSIGRPWPTKAAKIAVEPIAPAPADAVGGGDSHTPTPDGTFDGLVVEPTVGVATARTPYVAPVAEKTPAAPAYSDAELIDDATYEAFQREFTSLDLGQYAAIKDVATKANEAGHSVSLSVCRSVRRLEIGRCLVAWAAAGRSEDDLRACLYLATKQEDVLQPGIPVGAAVGVLTTEEARAVRLVIETLTEGREIPDPATGVPVTWVRAA